jgi:hypothetical protein
MFLSQPELLRAAGMRITPKGCTAIILAQELDKTVEEVEPLAQRIADSVFLNGWIYVQEDQLRLAEDPGLDD